MKIFTLTIVFLAASVIPDVASANGGFSAVRVRPALFPRRAAIAAPVVVAPVVRFRAPAVRFRAAPVIQFQSPPVIQYQAPIIVQPQAYALPPVQLQSFNYVAPQVQAYAVPQCSSAAFFAY